MKNLPLLFLSGLLVFSTLLSCNKSESKSTIKDDEPKNVVENEDIKEQADATSDAISNAMDQLGNLQDGDVEIISYKDLQKSMPDNLEGLPIIGKMKGSTSKMGNFEFSQVSVKYGKDNKNLKVEITDTGKIPMLVTAMAQYANMNMSSESDEGYEKTIKINGQPGMIKHRTSTNNTEVDILYNERFVISVDGNNVDADDVKDAAQKIMKSL